MLHSRWLLPIVLWPIGIAGSARQTLAAAEKVAYSLTEEPVDAKSTSLLQTARQVSAQHPPNWNEQNRWKQPDRRPHHKHEALPMNPAQEAIAKALGWGWHRHPNLPWNPEERSKHRAPTAVNENLEDIDIIDDLPGKSVNGSRQELWHDDELDKLGPDEIDRVETSMHIAVSIMLLGLITFLMALIYFVNFPDPEIQEATWNLLSKTMAIFIAVLIFSSTQEAMAHWIEEGAPHHGHEIGHGSRVTREILLVSFGRLLLFWLVLLVVIFFEKRSSTALHRFGMLFGHIVAFAGLDAFGTLQESDFFSRSLGHSLGAVFFSFILLGVMLELVALARASLFPGSRRQQAVEEWMHECRVFEHEMAGMILGLLISQSIRFAISGRHPPPHCGDTTGRPWTQVFLLLTVICCVGGLFVPLESSFQAWRAILLVRSTIAMLMAWCLLFWLQWAFWRSTHDTDLGYGDKMTALLTTALLVSTMCFAAVFIMHRCDSFEEHAPSQWSTMAVSGNALGFVMGLAWENTFHAAVEGIGDLQYMPVSLGMNTIIIFSVLSVVVFPAWWCIILPRALKRSVDFKSEERFQ